MPFYVLGLRAGADPDALHELSRRASYARVMGTTRPRGAKGARASASRSWGSEEAGAAGHGESVCRLGRLY